MIGFIAGVALMLIACILVPPLDVFIKRARIQCAAWLKRYLATLHDPHHP